MEMPEAPEAAGEPSLDSGLACLLVLARFHGVATDAAQLAHLFRENGKPFAVEEIVIAARSLRLKAKAVDSDISRLPRLPLPAIALDVDGTFVVLARADDRSVLVHDPKAGRPQMLSHAEWQQRWSGKLILFTSRASIAGELARFDFSWFIPALVKYRKLLGEVLIVSFFLQLIGLATPLFFQVVVDKVLVHQSFDTLDVIAVGLLCCSIFESLLSGLRTYVFSHTTSRIDVELGARLFRHLLALPLAYFQARRVGIYP